MPILKSAIKKMRQAQKHHERNVAFKVFVKKIVDEFKKSPSSEGLSKASSALDKAAKRNIIHSNKASRLKSRLNKRLNSKSDVVSPKKTSTLRSRTKSARA